MDSSAHEHMSSVGLPSAWEDRAPSPRPNTPYLQGIYLPPSPQTFSEYFQDTLSPSLPKDHHNITSFSMELAMSSHSGTAKLLPTDPVATQSIHAQSDQLKYFTGALPLGFNQHQGISSSVSAGAAAAAAAAVDASQNHPQQSKPLSRHQIYRMNVKGKAKFKDLSHQILNEHIKMLNEELLRMTGELKTKDEQLSHLLSENHMLRKQNKRLKLPSSVTIL